MEFGRKQERPYLRLIESAAFESRFSKRSETKEKTTDTLLKQDVLRDDTFSIGRVIASIQPSIFQSVFCLFHSHFLKFCFLLMCNSSSPLLSSPASLLPVCFLLLLLLSPAARSFGRRGNHSLQCQQGAELLSPVINWLSNKNISLRYNQGLIQAGHLCVWITMEAYALPLQLCYF